MAETPPLNEALLREVDDAVRQDQLLGIWNRFGRWIVGLIVVGLAAFGGWLYWNHHSQQQSGEIAEQAQKAIESKGQVVVGVNEFVLEEENPIPTMSIDPMSPGRAPR